MGRGREGRQGEKRSRARLGGVPRQRESTDPARECDVTAAGSTFAFPLKISSFVVRRLVVQGISYAIANMKVIYCTARYE